MWKLLAFAGLVACAASPATAQCISIPLGNGDAAVHCADGSVGRLHAEPGGGVAGMVGSQAFVAPPDTVTSAAPSAGPSSAYLNAQAASGVIPLPSAKPPPPPAAPAPPAPPRPFPTYPDPEAAGLRLQPGEE